MQYVRLEGGPGVTLRFGVFDHQLKGATLKQALEDAGHIPIDDARIADVLLVDFDGDYAHPRPKLIQATLDSGGIVLVYPHGAYPTFQYFSTITADNRVAAHLVQGLGVAAVYQHIGMTVPVHVIGWYYCPLVPFQPVGEVRRILFCPAHPSGARYLCDAMKAENARIYRTLLDCNAELHVSLYGKPEDNGLWLDPSVSYWRGDLNLFWEDIDQADLVVAEGTKGYMAVARGKPVVMFAQDYAPRTDDDPSQIPGWDQLGPMLKYPISFDADRFAEQAEAACAGSPETAEWRDRMVGRPWNPAGFVQLVERLYEERNADVGTREVGGA